MCYNWNRVIKYANPVSILRTVFSRSLFQLDVLRVCVSARWNSQEWSILHIHVTVQDALVNTK